MPTGIIIADDHPMLLDGLKAVLEKIDGIRVLDTVLNGRQLIDCLHQQAPDLVLLDLNMPNLNGIDTLKILREKFPELKVIILSSYYQPELLREVSKLGAQGYLPKSSSAEVLQNAIKTVIAGEMWFPGEETEVPDVSPYFVDSFMKKFLLTKREVEIIRLIGKGFSTKKIGEKLFVSEFTVNAHRRNISRKLNIHTPLELMQFANEQGLI